jgi:hypothetical protein
MKSEKKNNQAIGVASINEISWYEKRIMKWR